ncbi:hypothetical protein BVX98_06420 [bacterium F11]|nr:hypothetical protein BVX98_06420 [bacterium F11]
MRKQYITHPKFQYSFTFSFVLGILLILIFLGGTSLATLYLISKQSFLTLAQQQNLSEGIQSLLRFVLLLGMPSLFMFTLLGLYLSYKFVGPLYRLENWLEFHLLGKNPPPLKLRPGDELQPIANILAQTLSQKHSKRGG